MTVLEELLATWDTSQLQRLALCARAHGRTVHQEVCAIARLGEWVQSHTDTHGHGPDEETVMAWHREHNVVVDHTAMVELADLVR